MPAQAACVASFLSGTRTMCIVTINGVSTTYYGDGQLDCTNRCPSGITPPDGDLPWDANVTMGDVIGSTTLQQRQ
jgi:hypothetical protein